MKIFKDKIEYVGEYKTPEDLLLVEEMKPCDYTVEFNSTFSTDPDKLLEFFGIRKEFPTLDTVSMLRES